MEAVTMSSCFDLDCVVLQKRFFFFCLTHTAKVAGKHKHIIEQPGLERTSKDHLVHPLVGKGA